MRDEVGSLVTECEHGWSEWQDVPETGGAGRVCWLCGEVAGYGLPGPDDEDADSWWLSEP